MAKRPFRLLETNRGDTGWYDFASYGSEETAVKAARKHLTKNARTFPMWRMTMVGPGGVRRLFTIEWKGDGGPFTTREFEIVEVGPGG